MSLHTMCQRLRCDAHLSPRSESRVGRTTATLYILFSCLYQYICVAIKAGYVQSSTGRHSSLKGMPPNNRLKEHAPPPHRTRRWIPQLARATRDDVRLLPIGRPDDDPLVACHGAQRSASSWPTKLGRQGRPAARGQFVRSGPTTCWHLGADHAFD